MQIGVFQDIKPSHRSFHNQHWGIKMLEPKIIDIKMGVVLFLQIERFQALVALPVAAKFTSDAN